MTLDELITALERAEGPARELDEAICLLLNPWLADLPRTDSGGWLHPEYGLIAPAPAYSESLDAAMTLVLKGTRWAMGVAYPTPDRKPVAWANIGKTPIGGGWTEANESEAATPALALSAAALKALQAMEAKL